MSEESPSDPRAGLDVRELARELIAEELDLDDIFVDRGRTMGDPADTRASKGEPAHRATAVQVQRPRSDPPEPDEAEKVVLRRPPFRPMRLTSAKTEPATSLSSATPHEATAASLASLSSPPKRRHPLAWLALLLLVGSGAAAIAHQALTRVSQESPTP